MAVAPGKPLREGLDRVLQAGRGALMVVGDGPEVLSICSGGFLIDAELSPQRLSEVAKMDGAIVLAHDARRIARANVHLVPDPDVPTTETGTRHRTAERVARSIDVPVISVSEDMSIITVYRNALKHQLQPIPALLSRADQALQTLERYKRRLDAVSAVLSAREVGDAVALRDVLAVLQRAEMVRRIAEEIDGYLAELGEDGRMLLLQFDELMGGAEDERRMVVRDYLRASQGRDMDEAIDSLATLSADELLDLRRIATSVLGLGDMALDCPVAPRGYRLLSRLPRLTPGVVSSMIDRFGSLSRLLHARESELAELEGVGEGNARSLLDSIGRIAESSVERLA